MSNLKRLLSATLVSAMLLTVPVSGYAETNDALTASVFFEPTASKTAIYVSEIADQVYTGKSIKPTVSVSEGSKTLKKGTDYTVSYKSNKNVGTAKAVIKGKGDYSFSKTISFKIVPATTKLTVKKSGANYALSWTKAKGASKYEVYYATNNGSFKQLTSTSKLKYFTNKLNTSKNSYLIKVRAYKKSGSKTYYGDWSNVVSLSGNTISADAVAKLDNPNLKVTKQIKNLSWFPIDETSAAAQLFKKTYGTPSKDGIFETIMTSYADRYDKLAMLIASGDSPDIFPFIADDYPYGVVKGRYQSINKLININSPKYDSTRDLIEQMKLNGKYYVAPTSIDFSNLMYYKNSNIKALGVEDPMKMFENGTWTWDAFLDITRKWQASGDDKYAIDGYNSDYDFVISTGVPMIGKKNGKIVSNLNSKAVERAEDLLTTLQQENLRYPRHELNGWNVNPKQWANNSTLFYADGGTWAYESTLKLFEQRFAWSADEIRVVPFPRDPESDTHYIQPHISDGYMWVKGSTNKNGVAAWLDCCATVANDSKVIKANKESQKNNNGWSADNINAIYKWTDLDNGYVTPVFDFKFGLGYVSDNSSTESPMQSLTNLVYLTGDKTYTQLREEHEPAINAAIDEINSAIKKLK